MAAAPKKRRRVWLISLSILAPSCCVSALRSFHEGPDELRNLIRCGIEREMARLEDVDFGLRHVAAIGLRLRKLEGKVVVPRYRSDRNAARSSATNSCGCSHAAKWPPLATRL